MPALLVNGIAMQYQDYDAPDAPLIVLVQGIGAGGGVWSLHEVPEFVTVRYRVISYDNRGITALPGEKETLCSDISVDDRAAEPRSTHHTHQWTRTRHRRISESQSRVGIHSRAP